MKDKYEIPSEERARRWDLRNLQICSIDPVGCRDIDDALHCRVLENGRYEVGVHIADVKIISLKIIISKRSHILLGLIRQ